jgi:hypothetical protein
MLKNLGPLEWSIVLATGLILLTLVAITIWAIVDAALRPESQWPAAGQSKPLWIVMMVAGALLLPPIGTLLAIAYLVAIRPKLIRML